MVKKSEASRWKIEHECPQCGGPVTLEETDRLFFCSYCRVRLFLQPQDFFRYYLPPSESFSREIFFVPYWRFKGNVFFCRDDGVKFAFNDISSLASSHPFFPSSLGFRPQTLRLRCFSSNVQGRLLPHQVPLRSVIEKIEKRAELLDNGHSRGQIFYKAFIGESISLIYSPLFIRKGILHDAIVGKPVASIAKDFLDDLTSFDHKKDWQVKFVPTLCPRCGWDLLGERDSVVLFCQNCDSVWEAEETGLKTVDFGRISNQREKEDASYLPFWRIEAAVEGMSLQSYADLLRFANAPIFIKREWEDLSLYFWAPAFKIPPGPFLRSAQTLTLSEPQEELECYLPRSPLCPVNFPATEAAESMKVTLANIVSDKRNVLPRLHEMDIQIKKFDLIFLPFTLVGGDFIQSHSQLCLHKNFLQLGRNL